MHGNSSTSGDTKILWSSFPDLRKVNHGDMLSFFLFAPAQRLPQGTGNNNNRKYNQLTDSFCIRDAIGSVAGF